jgi:hypothetical protein
MNIHPVQDSFVQTSSFDARTGTFTVPAYTTTVFVLSECCQGRSH